MREPCSTILQYGTTAPIAIAPRAPISRDRKVGPERGDGSDSGMWTIAARGGGASILRRLGGLLRRHFHSIQHIFENLHLIDIFFAHRTNQSIK